jgi:hypothetical protein
VSQTSEDVVIRAAYRALMRRYHPDADPSGDAAQRARAINAAYAVLSDPEQRTRYDGSLAAQGLIKPDAPHRPSLIRRMVPGPAGIIGLAALVTVGALMAISPPIGVLPDDALPMAAESHAAHAALDEPGVAPPSQAAADLCGDPAVAGLIKAELLSRAAAVSGVDREHLRQAGSLASLRLSSSWKHGMSSGSCGAGVSLDLPPGIVVDGGRTNLNANLTYNLSDGREGVHLSSLAGAGALVRSLATIGPAPSELPEVVPVQVVEVKRPQSPIVVARAAKTPMGTVASVPATRTSPEKVAAAVPAKAATSDCLGSGWADRAICGSSNLTALYRQHGLLYAQSMAKADQAKRAALMGSRQRFQQKRDACRSEICLTNAYIARLREISDIMARSSQQ